MSKDKWYNDIFEINESKAGKPYIRFTEDAEAFGAFQERIRPGGVISLKDFHGEIDKSVELNKITKEKGEELHSKLEFKIFTADLGPNQD